MTTKVTKGAFWSLTEHVGLQLVQFVISIVLARLLVPEQYGLIGMLALFVGLAQSLTNSGFGSALIQKNDATHLDFCSVFFFNLLIAIALTALLFASAPLIAVFYREPMLAPLTRVLALNVVLVAIGLVPGALLTKHMDFRAFVWVSVISVTISGAAALALAFWGVGVWALVAQQLINTLLRSVLLWRVSGWRPGWAFNVDSLKAMFPFGSRLLLYGLLETTFQNIYQPLFGKLYSAAALGYYVRAQGMQAAFVQPTVATVSRVMFPALAPLQGDKPRLRQAYRRTMTTAVLFHFPLMIALIVLANPLIVLLMTERWAPSVSYFQLLCLDGLLWPLYELNLVNLKAIGRSDLLFRLEFIKKALIILSVVVAYRWGIAAVLCGQVVASIVAYTLTSYFSGRLIGYFTTHQIRDFMMYLLMALGMGGCMYFAGKAVAPLPVKVAVEVLVGAVVYLGLNFLIGRQVLIDVLHLVSDLVRKPQADAPVG